METLFLYAAPGVTRHATFKIFVPCPNLVFAVLNLHGQPLPLVDLVGQMRIVCGEICLAHPVQPESDIIGNV